ncbi:NAD kinase [Leptolyngbya sp. 15MV]|nr:NAD kinase [Leptolyngbya sp. 15MV]
MRLSAHRNCGWNSTSIAPPSIAAASSAACSGDARRRRSVRARRSVIGRASSATSFITCRLAHRFAQGATNSGALPNGTPAHRVAARRLDARKLKVGSNHGFARLALLASDTARAQEAASEIADAHPWVPTAEADAIVVLGGDGFMLQTLHGMLDSGDVRPVYGLNLGTVGFLMNRYRAGAKLIDKVNRSRSIGIAPLRMEATTQDGEKHVACAINEVSLLRETRQTAKIEVSVDDRVRIKELVCDGVLVATPAGSTAYNLSANGPILPLDSQLLALTPISPFRPRRWRGAILPDRSTMKFRVNEPDKRPVSAVADQKEFRDIAEVSLEIAADSELTLLFDPGHALDERIVAEQFVV